MSNTKISNFIEHPPKTELQFGLVLRLGSPRTSKRPDPTTTITVAKVEYQERTTQQLWTGQTKLQDLVQLLQPRSQGSGGDNYASDKPSCNRQRVVRRKHAKDQVQMQVSVDSACRVVRQVRILTRTGCRRARNRNSCWRPLNSGRIDFTGNNRRTRTGIGGGSATHHRRDRVAETRRVNDARKSLLTRGTDIRWTAAKMMYFACKNGMNCIGSRFESRQPT